MVEFINKPEDGMQEPEGKFENNKKLYRLRDLNDFEVADDDPDIRGWDVLDMNGETIGEVSDLIVDPEMLKVKYLDIETKKDLDPGTAGRHLLIPVAAARLDEDDNEVFINELNKTALKDYPVYKGEPVTLDYEHSLREAASGRLRTKEPGSIAGGNPDAAANPPAQPSGFTGSKPAPKYEPYVPNPVILRKKREE